MKQVEEAFRKHGRGTIDDVLPYLPGMTREQAMSARHGLVAEHRMRRVGPGVYEVVERMSPSDGQPAFWQQQIPSVFHLGTLFNQGAAR